MITVPAHTKLLIFDLDSTIVYLRVDWAGVKARLAQTFPDISFDSLSAGIRTIRTSRTPTDLSHAWQIIRTFEAARLPHMEPLPATLDCIHAHAGTIPLAVCSNNLHQTVDDVLTMLGVRSSFHAIVGRDDVLESKPDPEGLLAIIRTAAVAPVDAYFIGDHAIDVRAGASAQIPTLLLHSS